MHVESVSALLATPCIALADVLLGDIAGQKERARCSGAELSWSWYR